MYVTYIISIDQYKMSTMYKKHNKIQENWAKYLNMNGYNHGKICLTSLVVLEIKIKTISLFSYVILPKQHVEEAIGK